MPFRFLFLSLWLTALSSCSAQTDADDAHSNTIPVVVKEPMKPDSILSRDAIFTSLKSKVENRQPLVVHVFVPLCDNANQGIVPVPEKLGDGRNLLTNLYWGALYGVKTHFLRTAKWTVLLDKKYTSGSVLERVVFYKQFENGAKVYMIADAYAGDKMMECLSEYLSALAGNDSSEIKLKDTTIQGYGRSNLLVFNGHDGLMELYPDTFQTQKAGHREAMSISCASHNYFPFYISYTGSYPLLTTTNLLGPEAYVLEAAVNNWALLKGEEEIRKAAGNAYLKYQDCGKKYADGLFHTGW